jgi:hypothetical protein
MLNVREVVAKLVRGMIEAMGFEAVAQEMEQAAAEYRRNEPRAPRRPVPGRVPSLDRHAGLLILEDHTWPIQKREGPTQELLNALHDCGFQLSVRLPWLTPDQVREAAKVLRKKTMPIINWHASVDGTLSWSLPPK